MRLQSNTSFGTAVRRWHTRGPTRLPHLDASFRRGRRAVTRRASSLDDESTPKGDSDMQDSLVDLLRAEIQKENFKAEIRQDVKGKQEQLRKIGEELLAQLDTEAELDKRRSELDINLAMSDTLQQFNDLEEEINKWKRQVQLDRQELADFEQQSAAARSKGLFFKELYVPDKAELVGDDQVLAIDQERLQQTRSNVVAPAEAEVASPLRLYLFTYMAAVLLFFVAQDVVSDDPSYGLDAIYGVLATVLGINTYNERKLLLEKQGLGGSSDQGSSNEASSSNGSSSSGNDSDN